MATLESREQAASVAVLYHERGPGALYDDARVADLLAQAATMLGVSVASLHTAAAAARSVTRGRSRLFVLTPTGGDTHWHRR